MSSLIMWAAAIFRSAPCALLYAYSLDMDSLAPDKASCTKHGLVTEKHFRHGKSELHCWGSSSALRDELDEFLPLEPSNPPRGMAGKRNKTVSKLRRPKGRGKARS